MAQALKIGVVGCGAMGGAHARAILDGAIPRAQLVAVSDADPGRRQAFGVRGYADALELMGQSGAEAIIIATPHPSHASLCQAALQRGLHVLCEKPLTVSIGEAEALLALPRREGQRFALVLHQRFFPVYQKLRAMVQGGELGPIQRVLYEITDWFRSDAYYQSGSWRATWEGEGGGLLMNQCPHNLDLLQWVCGMPVRLRAFCGNGRHHAIEVEDEVSAFLEFENGATGVFISSTGEAPGINRWEIVGDKATALVEGDVITLRINQIPASEFKKTSREGMAKPASESSEIRPGQRPSQGAQNPAILNFVESILDGKALLAPAEDGLQQVMLSNAMIYSSAKGRGAELPLAAADYAGLLEELIAHSRAAGSRP